MSFDHHMIRGDVPNGFNLAVGEPIFLQNLFSPLYKLYKSPSDQRYPPYQGQESLLESIKEYHRGKYSHVVVTVGAKQALSAALYAFKKMEDAVYVNHPTPYWPSYPTLIDLQGMVFVGNEAANIDMGTLINNPDGSICDVKVDVLDCAYASPVYGWDGSFPEHRVSVWSAAKLFGMSGMRIGWLATNEPELAKEAADYVEKATSGVSTFSQSALCGVLNSTDTEDFLTVRDAARVSLCNNYKFYSNLLSSYMAYDHGAVDWRGMYAWFKPLKEERFANALKRANIKVIPGVACGRPDWYRMSLGVDSLHLYDALTKLRWALDND